MENLREIVERNRQVGFRHFFDCDGRRFFETVGLQKFNGFYKVHIAEIDEAKMAAEEYELEEYKIFNSFDEAIEYILSNSKVLINQLSVSKGQKFFNPEFE